MNFCCLFSFCVIYRDRQASWQQGGSSALSLVVCSAPEQTGSWGSHRSDRRYSTLKTGSSEGQRERGENGLWKCKRQNWYPINKTVNRLAKCDEMGDIQTTIQLPSPSFCCFGWRLLWWVMCTSQNKSHFLLENWIALKAHHLFLKYCMASK